MATVVASTVAVTERSTPIPELSKLNTAHAVPNKHIPYCSPGPRPALRQFDTPTFSSPSPPQSLTPASLLNPPFAFDKIVNDPPVYALSADALAKALDHLAGQPLPLPEQVFPWLHGLHPENQMQLSFFVAKKKAHRRTPKCIRGITVVKVGGDLSHSKIKGAIAPDEILSASNGSPRAGEEHAEFLYMDPKDGFSVRNFQIQASKMAAVSDIVVYGDNVTPTHEIERVARRVSRAQAEWARKVEGSTTARPFNTFMLTDDYTVVEADHPDIIALDSEGCVTNKIMDFFDRERMEMCRMFSPTEISHNVWLGPTPDPCLTSDPVDSESDYDAMIECSDVAQLPDAAVLKMMDELLFRRKKDALVDRAIPQLDFPGSGAISPPTWSQAEVDALLASCEWIYKQAHGLPTSITAQRRDSKLSLGVADTDGDSPMPFDDSSTPRGRKILIHCTDGYTESSLLALTYYMYAECKPVHEAWLDMHVAKKRNFFAYSTDVDLLRAIQPRILQASPRYSGDISRLCPPNPAWLDKMDGSLPSRVLDYLYLGNLVHANNPDLLKLLGIGQILSVGQPMSWSRAATESWGQENLMYINLVEDNGVDALTNQFPRCLEFIERGRRQGLATLVHCRVGVSRSATVCIAEVMKELDLSFPRAYCFVRARRLNVIIQPHLRFSYELLKWEEDRCLAEGRPLRRELEWATIAREIAAMNKPYSRQS